MTLFDFHGQTNNSWCTSSCAKYSSERASVQTRLYLCKILPHDLVSSNRNRNSMPDILKTFTFGNYHEVYNTSMCNCNENFSCFVKDFLHHNWVETRFICRAAFMCGREPNFELSENEKQQLGKFNWDEFLAITRSAITSKSKPSIKSSLFQYIFLFDGCDIWIYRKPEKNRASLSKKTRD